MRHKSIKILVTFSFQRAHRLKSKKGIGELFSGGIRLKKYPVSLVYSPDSERVNGLLKVGLSVAKKSVPRAVDRNRIKRLLREAIRLNITNLFNEDETLPKGYNVMIIYHGNKDCNYADVENKIILLLKRFKDQISI